MGFRVEEMFGGQSPPYILLMNGWGAIYGVLQGKGVMNLALCGGFSRVTAGS